jgi:hypothetical protein
MCKTCDDAMTECFPEATDDDRNYILWNETCFPFGCGDRVAEQIREFKRKQQPTA